MTLRILVPLALCLAVPFAVLYGLSRLSRWYLARHDQIEIRPPRWCKDGDSFMNTMDWQKANRAGERRWQETLRAQRKARKKPAKQAAAQNVIPIRRRSA